MTLAPSRPARVVRRECARAALALLLAAAPLAAAEPWDAGLSFVRAYDVAAGLPQNTVHDLLIGSDGRLWVATQDGLAHFDGRAWADVELPVRQRSNFVRALLESGDGSLWVGTQAGGLLRRHAGEWKVFWGDADEGPGDLRVNALAETAAGEERHLWVATHDAGLARFDGRAWRHWRRAEGLPGDRVWDLLVVPGTDGDRLWLATDSGPAWIELPDGPVVVPPGAPAEPANSLGARRRGEGEAPEVWVGFYGTGLAGWIDGAWRRVEEREGLASLFVTDLAPRPDDPGALWVSTDGGGLHLFDGQSARRLELGAVNSSRAVYRVLETTAAQGAEAIWAGTRHNGLLRIVTGYWRSIEPPPALAGSAVSALLLRDGEPGGTELWLGTDGGGLAVWRDGAWSRHATATGELGHDAVLALAETRRVGGGRRVWVGTRNGGLSEWDGARWRRHDRASGALPGDLVQALAEEVLPDGRARLWVGTREGVASWDGAAWRHADPQQGWPTSSILSLLPETDSAGRAALWIGTSTGLYRWRDGAMTHWGEGLTNSTVHALHLRTTAGGRELWLGTDGGGVMVLDPDASEARPRPLALPGLPPLPNGVVYSILEDRMGRLYLPSNRGVIRLTPDPRESRLELMTEEHGLPSNQASRGAAAVDRRGRIWIGTVAGAAAFDPMQEPTASANKPLVLAASAEGVPLAGGARLRHSEARLHFRFALLSFFGESLTRYRTQLVPFDDEPSAWSAVREREFGRLPAGEYQFRVWGRDASKRISGPVEIAFTVAPAPWQTPAARLAMLAVLIAGVYALVRARGRVHERRSRRLEELVAARTARLARANGLLIELSYVDSVTAVPNRRRFDEMFEAEWKRAARTHLPLALVMIDVDRFKEFNDTHGHQRGDDCLRQVAQALADGLSRSGDAIARYGGEEFTVILPATDGEGARRVAEHLRERVEELAIPNAASEVAVVTVSCGVAATQPSADGEMDELLTQADRALYEAKRMGRNRVVVAG
ncbi:MAG: diguanylate cyclase [Thermoanaerobaculia bacterium]|nr:diguanylate cyclase [Thermoanaerobaculia bacterium]